MGLTVRCRKTTMEPTGLIEHVHAEDRSTSGPQLLIATSTWRRRRHLMPVENRSHGRGVPGHGFVGCRLPSKPPIHLAAASHRRAIEMGFWREMKESGDIYLVHLRVDIEQFFNERLLVDGAKDRDCSGSVDRDDRREAEEMRAAEEMAKKAMAVRGSSC
ncbi:hypothetical protein BHE74_00020594 [Ensete ventricosum]|nr:hypothetical protein BHE74_00020594 [Ensete ventricosum]